jgi:hypothetical protein
MIISTSRSVSSESSTSAAFAVSFIGYDEAGHEILIFSGWFSGGIEEEAHNLVTGPLAAVP